MLGKKLLVAAHYLIFTKDEEESHLQFLWANLCICKQTGLAGTFWWERKCSCDSTWATPVINPNVDIQGGLFKGESPPYFGLFTLTLETGGVYLIMLKSLNLQKCPPRHITSLHSTTPYVLNMLIVFVSCILYGIHLIQLKKLKFQKFKLGHNSPWLPL